MLLAFRAGNIIQFDNFDWEIGRKWLVVNISFLFMLYSGSMSLKLAGVHIVTAYKNLAIFFITLGEWILNGQEVSRLVAGSIGLMILGPLLTGMTDLDYTFIGYMWLMFNILGTSLYVLLMRKSSKYFNLGEWGMSYYNNLISLPLLLAAAVLMGELPILYAYPHWFNPSFLVALGVSGALGFLISVASFWCISINSATTFSMLGALNKVPLSILGAFLFSAAVTLSNALSLAIGLCGGLLYAYGKYLEMEAKAKSTTGRPRGKHSMEEKEKHHGDAMNDLEAGEVGEEVSA
jgi:GDP-mannose transporter